LHQVLKFPSLISHFTEHKALNQQISFIDFLSMHYWGDDLNDNDDEKDMQLPFKKIDIQQHSNFLYIPSENIFTFKRTFWPVRPSYGPDKPQGHYNTAFGALFRPPRA
jgi:hypothetical protein